MCSPPIRTEGTSRRADLRSKRRRFERKGTSKPKRETRIETTPPLAQVWSVDRKLRLQRKDRVDDLRDVAALRVVVESGEDDDHGVALCYRVLRRLASSPYVASVGHVKDYIRAPKANGYQSLHATVVPSARNLPRFEVQIRTVAMDRDATHGDASHRRYKRAQRRAP